MTGSKKHSTRENYFGTDVKNNTDTNVPEHILLQAVILRQMLIDEKLPISITVGIDESNYTTK